MIETMTEEPITQLEVLEFIQDRVDHDLAELMPGIKVRFPEDASDIRTEYTRDGDLDVHASFSINGTPYGLYWRISAGLLEPVNRGTY